MNCNAVRKANVIADQIVYVEFWQKATLEGNYNTNRTGVLKIQQGPQKEQNSAETLC